MACSRRADANAFRLSAWIPRTRGSRRTSGAWSRDAPQGASLPTGRIRCGEPGDAHREGEEVLNHVPGGEGPSPRSLAEALDKPVSKLRWIVEQCFGKFRRFFDETRARHMILEKVEAQVINRAMAMSLLKVANRDAS